MEDEQESNERTAFLLFSKSKREKKKMALRELKRNRKQLDSETSKTREILG